MALACTRLCVQSERGISCYYFALLCVFLNSTVHDWFVSRPLFVPCAAPRFEFVYPLLFIPRQVIIFVLFTITKSTQINY